MTAHGRLWLLVGLVAGTVAFGTVGYMAVEGWSLFDALYMTLITVASVGYGEVHPLSAVGRVFTMVLIVIGLGTVAYGLSTITAFLVEGDLSHLWEKRKMERRIAELRDHIVLCGCGETGWFIARELVATRTPFVVIDQNPAQEATIRKLGEGVLYVLGDATHEHVLRRARVDTARGLIASTASDKDNLFMLLTARELNPRLRIVTRVVDEASRGKLLRAGADAVVSSTSIGALRLASEMLRPHVVGVLDTMLREAGAVRVEEITVGPEAAGRPLGALRLQERAGIVVFALREGDGARHLFNPPAERPLQAGDVLIACADRDQLEAARRIAKQG